MKQSTFVSALKFASHAAAIRDVRYYLNGVLFEFRGAALALVGTDGHRMAYVELDNHDSQLPDTDMIVPGDSVKLLLAAFKANSTGTIDFELDSEKLLIRGAGGQAIHCSPIEGKYPDWRRVCKSDKKPVPTERISFNADYMPAAAKACGALDGSKYACVIMELFGPSSSMCFSPGELPAGVVEARVIVMPMRL